MAASHRFVSELFAQGRVHYNNALARYVQGVAAMFLAGDDSLRAQVQCYVLRSASPVAFSAPGGRVFVSVGLLACLEGPGELGFVLCHEFAHLRLHGGLPPPLADLRDTPPLADSLRLSTPGIEGGLPHAHGDLAREYEADWQGLLYLARAGYGHAHALGALRHSVPHAKGAAGGRGILGPALPPEFAVRSAQAEVLPPELAARAAALRRRAEAHAAAGAWPRLPPPDSGGVHAHAAGDFAEVAAAACLETAYLLNMSQDYLGALGLALWLGRGVPDNAALASVRSHALWGLLRYRLVGRHWELAPEAGGWEWPLEGGLWGRAEGGLVEAAPSTLCALALWAAAQWRLHDADAALPAAMAAALGPAWHGMAGSGRDSAAVAQALSAVAWPPEVAAVWAAPVSRTVAPTLGGAQGVPRRAWARRAAEGVFAQRLDTPRVLVVSPAYAHDTYLANGWARARLRPGSRARLLAALAAAAEGVLQVPVLTECDSAAGDLALLHDWVAAQVDAPDTLRLCAGHEAALAAAGRYGTWYVGQVAVQSAALPPANNACTSCGWPVLPYMLYKWLTPRYFTFVVLRIYDVRTERCVADMTRAVRYRDQPGVLRSALYDMLLRVAPDAGRGLGKGAGGG